LLLDSTNTKLLQYYLKVSDLLLARNVSFLLFRIVVIMLVILVLVSSFFEYINVYKAPKKDADLSLLLPDGIPQLQQEYSKFSVETNDISCFFLFCANMS